MQIFSKAIGGRINHNKSQIIFHNKTRESFVQNIYHMLQIPKASEDLIYMGMSMPFKHKKRHVFQHIIDRCKKRENWKSNSLSKAGKLVFYQIYLLIQHPHTCYELLSISKGCLQTIDRLCWEILVRIEISRYEKFLGTDVQKEIRWRTGLL